jgi:hypothetical protein
MHTPPPEIMNACFCLQNKKKIAFFLATAECLETQVARNSRKPHLHHCYFKHWSKNKSPMKKRNRVRNINVISSTRAQQDSEDL